MTFDQAKAFVTAWQHARTFRGFCAGMGMDSGDARNISAYLRRLGVPLKKFPVRTGRPAGQRMTKAQVQELREIITGPPTVEPAPLLPEVRKAMIEAAAMRAKVRAHSNGQTLRS